MEPGKLGQVKMVQTITGVGLNIFGQGVILTGDSRIGKSELALELLSRGHKLIADDMLNLCITNGQLVMQNPIDKFIMHIKDIGFIDIESIFSSANTTKISNLDLIVSLTKSSNNSLLEQPKNEIMVLGNAITKYSVAVGLHRPLAILIETLTKYNTELNRGIDSHQDFINHQARMIKEATLCN